MVNVSLVLYNTSQDDIDRIIKTCNSCKCVNKLFLIDNSNKKNKEFEKLSSESFQYVFNSKNLGYGKAHNIAINETIKSNIAYHLVINPDIYFEPDVLESIIVFMNENPNVGQLMPKVISQDGSIHQYCKILPKPINLIARSFFPKIFYKKLDDNYSMKKFKHDKIIDVPNLSGCFMFFRTVSLKDVGVFDKRFFMYAEDIDLTRRIHRKYRTIYFPNVMIIHRHERASFKNLRMKLIHVFNVVRYFNKYGWFFDSERKRINNETLGQLN